MIASKFCLSAISIKKLTKPLLLLLTASFFQTSQALQPGLPPVMQIGDVIGHTQVSGVQTMKSLYTTHFYPESDSNASLDIDCSCPSKIEQCLRAYQHRLLHQTAIIGEDCAVPKSRAQAKKDGDFAVAHLIGYFPNDDGDLQNRLASATFVGNCQTMVTNAHNLYSRRASPTNPVSGGLTNQMSWQPHDEIVIAKSEGDTLIPIPVPKSNIFIPARTKAYYLGETRFSPPLYDDYAIIRLPEPAPNCNYLKLPPSPIDEHQIMTSSDLRLISFRFPPPDQTQSVNDFFYVDQSCGQVRSVPDPRSVIPGVVRHDFSTLKGNSGSPFIIDDDVLVGLHTGVQSSGHFRDTTERRNQDFSNFPYEQQTEDVWVLNYMIGVSGNLYRDLKNAVEGDTSYLDQLH